MALNTEHHQLTRCPLSLYKTQIDPVAIPAEAGDFWHGYHKIVPPHYPRLTKQRPVSLRRESARREALRTIVSSEMRANAKMTGVWTADIYLRTSCTSR